MHLERNQEKQTTLIVTDYKDYNLLAHQLLPKEADNGLTAKILDVLKIQEENPGLPVERQFFENKKVFFFWFDNNGKRHYVACDAIKK